MVVCRFFSQGTCKFGTNCRFEHPNQNTFQQQGVLRPSHFSSSQAGWGDGGGRFQSTGSGTFGGGTQQTAAQGQNQGHSYSEIFTTIAQEMGIWEKSKMWPFSCFGYAKAIPSLPGLEDLSMEEVRLKAYEANITGKASNYQQWIATMVSEYTAKRKQLETLDQATKTHLKKFIDDANNNAPTSQNAGTKPSLFAANTGKSPLGNDQQPMFGQTGVFASTVQPTDGSVLGGMQQQSSSTSVFGNPTNVPSVFGNPTNVPSVFGNSASNQGSASSVFGGTAAAQGTASVFGGTQGSGTSLFSSQTASQATQSSIFGSSGQSGTGLLGGVPSTAGQTGFVTVSGTQSLLGNAPAVSSVFGTTGQLGMAGVTSSTQSAFGSIAQAPINQSAFSNAGPQVQATQSTFGNLGQQGQTSQSAFTNVGQHQQMNQPSFGDVNQSSQSALGNVGQQSQSTQSNFGSIGTNMSNQLGQSAFGNTGQKDQTSQSTNVDQIAPNVSAPTTSTTSSTGTSGTSAVSTFSFATNQNQGADQATETRQAIGLFGKPVSQTGSVPGPSNTQLDENTYTPLDQLTSLEREQFDADQFTLGKIPLRPPPIELC